MMIGMLLAYRSNNVPFSVLSVSLGISEIVLRDSVSMSRSTTRPGRDVNELVVGGHFALQVENKW